jgi:hypothetical protein
MRQLAALRGGVHFCTLAVADVPDDAVYAVAVASDDAGFVELV